VSELLTGTALGHNYVAAWPEAKSRKKMAQLIFFPYVFPSIHNVTPL
jgi:hypothetical protein